MSKKRRIQVDLLPDVDTVRMWMTFQDKALHESVKQYPHLFDRASNAFRFIHWMGQGAKFMGCPEDELKRLREGLFRSALSEFFSIGDSLKYDFPELETLPDILNIGRIDLPLTVLFRELRNHQIHLKSHDISDRNLDVLWGNKDKPEEAKPIQITIHVLEDVTHESIQSLNNYSKYPPEDWGRLLDWFNRAQQGWGVAELLMRAIEESCQHIIENVPE